MSAQTAPELTTLHHLHELRRRLFYSVAALLVGGVVGYVYRVAIISFLQRPLHEKLFYTSPMGSFNFIMKLCLLTGFLIALPVLIYNLLRFIEPAFSNAFGKRVMVTIILASLALTLCGAAFAYYVSLPAALHFFGSVGSNSLQPLISVDQYFSFVLSYLGTFALVFQLPLLLLFINRITPIGPGSLGKWRKFVFIGAFAIALIVPSAPDPLSQVILALPIIALYEVSIVLVRLANYKHHRAAAKPEPALVMPGTVAVPESVLKPMAPMVSRPVRMNGHVINLREEREYDLGKGVLDLRAR